jgi:hypothetical protein
LDSIINNFTSSLISQKIDTICVYRPQLGGRFSRYATYITWTKSGKSFLKKQDLDFKYTTVDINTSDLWKYYFANIDSIKNDKLKPFQYVYNDFKGVQRIADGGIDHDIWDEIKIIIGNASTDLIFYQQNLKAKDGKRKNINYSNNINLKSVRFNNQLNKIVNTVEKKRRLNKLSR